MKISTFAPAVVSFSALVTASVAVADIDLLSDADNGSKKGIQAVIEDDCELVLDTVVYTKVGTIWVADEAETCVTEDAMLEEAPLKGELEMWSFFTVDCNGNGIADSTDIANGAMDWDADGTPDSCEVNAGDLNLNGIVDGQDLSILLGWWGISNPMFGDLNHDGMVNGIDMGMILGRFGAVVF
jgi:hypothetical protein